MEEFNFKEYLISCVKDYDGKHAIVINNLPNIYNLVTDLLDDEDLDFNLRRDIYVSLGYLFHPADIYPEDVHGPYGFIEDAMLLLFICAKAEKNHTIDFLKKYWKSENSLNDVMKYYDNLTELEEELFIKTLKITGFVDESF